MIRQVWFSALVLFVAACGNSTPEPKSVRQPTDEERAEAEAYLAEQTPLPAGWRFDRIPFGEGEHLRIGHASPKEPKATILFVPGYTSSPELASDFFARWYEMGLEVASVDLPGQGGSVRRDDDYQKPFTGDFAYFGQSVDAATRHLEKVRQSTGPLIVAGDSFGGHAILRAAADESLKDADGLFVLVPAVMPVLEGPKFLVKWFVGGKIRQGLGSAYMDGLGPWSPDDWASYDYTRCGDRADRHFKNAALFTTKPELRVGGATHEWALGFVTSGEMLMKDRELRDLTTPVTMVTAGQEVIVNNKYSEKLCTKGMPSCELIRIEEATHCLYVEDDPTQNKVHDALETLLARVETRQG